MLTRVIACNSSYRPMNSDRDIDSIWITRVVHSNSSCYLNREEFFLIVTRVVACNSSYNLHREEFFLIITRVTQGNSSYANAYNFFRDYLNNVTRVMLHNSSYVYN